MKRYFFTMSIALMFGFALEAQATEVIQKCQTVMTELEASNVENGCACFANEIGEDLFDAYMELDTAEWDAKAPQAMKDASEVCFPGFQES